MYSSHIYSLKDKNWLDNQIIAGTVLKESIQIGLDNCIPGKTTNEIDLLIENHIVKNNCIPTFKGYKGFPAATCISVNKKLVHGIPSDYILQDGDVIKLDSGATYNGVIADMARTKIVGHCKNVKHQQLIESCETALLAAINSFENGKPNYLGTIGNLISKEAEKINANVIVDLGGHGFEIDTPHGMPFVSNVGVRGDGPIIYPGTTLAIEPMFTFGDTVLTVSKEDGWTITLPDVGVHFEDTIFVTEEQVIVITR